MKALTTITEKELRISANHSAKTFTIRTTSSKYRTIRFGKDEFNHADRNWTGNDWQNFLKTDEYYKVK